MPDKDTIKLALAALWTPLGPINSKVYLEQYYAAVAACEAALAINCK